uniref:Cathepsin L-like cysteine protease n=1 Tax=Neobenedenia melleni TaxID=280695 RepID=A4KBK6_9PLAT|nr:cathepsin L-like cysteine protease [Neobenedenia melleni]ABK62795.1 cathepsin L-like cysteine protease [Neobenedenia melleni]
MHTFSVFLLLCVATALSVPTYPLFNQWSQWKVKYQKDYLSSEDELNKLLTWSKNLETVRKHNELYAQGKKSYTLAMNHMADLSSEEFKALYLVPKFDATKVPRKGKAAGEHRQIKNDPPSEIDWVRKGHVTAVKNQAQCGSCWAFSSTGSIEGAVKRATGKLISFSEQQLVDCSTAFGNHGCNGGIMDNSFNYLIHNKGLESEASYPYEAQKKECRYKKALSKGTISSFTDVSQFDEKDLKRAVGLVGPVSIAIDASQFSFHLYDSGVYDEEDCSQTMLNHGVLAVGYGTTPEGLDYWKVKNSWTNTWGMEGYILMSRNKDNQCGVATVASYPIV